MRRLILIRHAQTQPMPDIPASEWKLSAAGRNDCVLLASELRAYAPLALLTSTETKAVETGQLVAERLGIDCRTAPGLHEHDRTGQPYLGSHEAFQDQLRELFSQPDKRVYGRESAREALARFDEAVRRVTLAHPDVNVGIVAHGTVISLFVGRYGGPEPYAFWQRLGMPALVVFSLPQIEYDAAATLMDVGG